MSCECGKANCSDCNENIFDLDCRLRWCDEACPTDKINPDPSCYTLCDKCEDGNTLKKKNMFYVPKAPGYGYRCILDEMTFCQLREILASNPCAKMHLLAITTDPCVLQIAAQTSLKKPPCVQNMALQRRLSNNIPMYTFFKGSGMGKNIK